MIINGYAAPTVRPAWGWNTDCLLWGISFCSLSRLSSGEKEKQKKMSRDSAEWHGISESANSRAHETRANPVLSFLKPKNRRWNRTVILLLLHKLHIGNLKRLRGNFYFHSTGWFYQPQSPDTKTRFAVWLFLFWFNLIWFSLWFNRVHWFSLMQ